MEIQPTQTPITEPGNDSRTPWFRHYSLVLFLAFVLVETLILRRSFLWKVQELGLFVFNESFLTDKLNQTGGLTAYIASFLTQFFYYPWLGCLLYLALLTCLSWLTATAFHLKKHLRPYSFIPALAVLLSVTELGYDVLSLNVDGYAFVVPLGVMAALSGFLWYRGLRNNKRRSGFLFVWTLVAYPLAGVYALMGTLLMLLFTLRTWKQKQSKLNWMPLMIGLASLILLPLLINNTFFTAVGPAAAYTALLPQFSSDSNHLWLPFILLATSYLTLALLFPLNPMTTSSSFQRRTSPILLIAALLMVHVCGNRDNAFHTELNMERAYSSDDWQEVLKLSKQLGNKSNGVTTTYTNLSRHNLGLMEQPTYVTSSPFAGALIYYGYGDAENAWNWSMKQAARYGMSVYLLKYLTLSARATENPTLAIKYNETLKGTLFHRKWALEQASQIEHDITFLSEP